jgi:hypothetical protein
MQSCTAGYPAAASQHKCRTTRSDHVSYLLLVTRPMVSSQAQAHTDMHSQQKAHA